MTLRYTDEAEADLMAIVEYGFEKDLPDPIEHVLQIRDRLDTLHAAPTKGKRSPHQKGAKEWLVLPYLVLYREDGPDADVLRILHSRRKFP